MKPKRRGPSTFGNTHVARSPPERTFAPATSEAAPDFSVLLMSWMTRVLFRPPARKPDSTTIRAGLAEIVSRSIVTMAELTERPARRYTDEAVATSRRVTTQSFLSTVMSTSDERDCRLATSPHVSAAIGVSSAASASHEAIDKEGDHIEITKNHARDPDVITLAGQKSAPASGSVTSRFFPGQRKKKNIFLSADILG